MLTHEYLCSKWRNWKGGCFGSLRNAFENGSKFSVSYGTMRHILKVKCHDLDFTKVDRYIVTKVIAWKKLSLMKGPLHSKKIATTEKWLLGKVRLWCEGILWQRYLVSRHLNAADLLSTKANIPLKIRKSVEVSRFSWIELQKGICANNCCDSKAIAHNLLSSNHRTNEWKKNRNLGKAVYHPYLEGLFPDSYFALFCFRLFVFR